MQMRLNFERLGEFAPRRAQPEQPSNLTNSLKRPSIGHQPELPSPPELVVLQVKGERALGVKIVHSLRANGRLSSAAKPSGNDSGRPLQESSALEERSNFDQIAAGGCDEERLAASSKCALGARCSHWMLAERTSAASMQPKRPQVFGAQPFGAPRPNQSKQQKLAAFNQLLSQQLLILSYQQNLDLAANQRRPANQAGALAAAQASPDCEANTRSRRQLSSGSPTHCSRPNLDQCPSIAFKLMGGASQTNEASLAERAHERQLIITKYKGNTSLLPLTFSTPEPKLTRNPKVEWSLNEQMEPIVSSMIVYNTNSYPLECSICELANGQLYYVRVASGNHAGFSEPQASSPACLSPSTWRQIEGTKRRKYDEQVFRKFTKLILLNKHLLDEHQAGGQPSLPSGAGKSSLINMLLLDASSPVGEQHLQQRNNLVAEQQQQQQQPSLSVRKNLKSFFQSNSFKFHKLNNQNKRGLYLATVFYHSAGAASADKQPAQVSHFAAKNNADRLVVTNDDRLPVIEVLNDLVSPAALMSDFYWLLKINGTQWMDVKRLRQQLQKSHSSSTLHLRIKLLIAVEQMQIALNTEDIGRLFHKPIQAHDGSIVVCTCKQVSSTKLVGNLSIKWTNQHKIIPRHLRKISNSMLSNENLEAKLARVCKRDSSALSQNQQFGTQGLGASECVSQTGCQVQSTQRSASQSAALGLVASSSVATTAVGLAASSRTAELAADASQANPAEFKLCELCQFALVQRRSTMASGSSSSSLASASSESQWSASALSYQACAAPAAPVSARCACTCNRSAGSSLGGQVSGGGGGGGGAIANQSLLGSLSSRNSTASARSGSIIGTPTHHASIGSRHSQASQNFSAAQKSSNYLLLASLSLYDLLLFHLNEIIDFDRTSTIPLNRGLYLGFVQLQTTVESMRLLVPRSRPNMVPCARIRDNAHVSREEWQLLKDFANFNGSQTMLAQVSQSEQGDSQLRTPANQANSTLSDRASHLGAGERSNQSGFDRDRAKSVSPGLLQASAANCIRQQQADGSQHRDCLSISAERMVGQTSGLLDSRVASTETRSDTDLSLGQARVCNLPRTSQQTERSSTEAASDPSLGNILVDEVETPTNKLAECFVGEQPGGARRVEEESKVGAFNSNQLQWSSRSAHVAASRLTLNSLKSNVAQTPEETFVRLIGSAARRLLCELRSRLPKVAEIGGEEGEEHLSILQSLNDDENNRIYHLELIELSNQVSFILLIPAAENVCPVTSHEKSNILGNNKEYMLLPLQIFETIHIGTYEPELLGKYSRLSAILETDLIVAQHDHRQAFSSNELKSTKRRVNQLQDMVSVADEFWRQMRWIVDVVSFARDKSASSSNGCIRLATIWRYFDLSPSASLDQLPAASLEQTTGPESGGQQARQAVAPARDSETRWPVRASNDIKRTISVRARDLQSSLETTVHDPKSSCLQTIDSVPLINLQHSFGDQPSRPRAKKPPDPSPVELQPGESARRHSGGGLSVTRVESTPTLLHTSGQSFGCGPMEANRRIRNMASEHDDYKANDHICDSSADINQDARRQPADEIRAASGVALPARGEQLAMSEVNVGHEEEEEEAIYAYHISLKDATRAAVQRKSSQQSTQPIVGLEEPLTPCSGKLELDSLANLPVQSTSSLRRLDESIAAVGGERKYEAGPIWLDIQGARGGNESKPTARSGSQSSLGREGQAAGGEGPMSLGWVDGSDGDNSGSLGPVEPNLCGETSEIGLQSRLASLATNRAALNSENGSNRSSESRMKHFKSTNPFLSDSLDLERAD